MSHLHARRRLARRRRRLLRLDMAFGVLIAALTLLLAPGLAIVGIAALLVLAFCAGSLLFERSSRISEQEASG